MGRHGQYCPVSKAADLLGDRWTILIVRELQFGPLGFNEFARGLPGISRSVLSQRLRRMTADGVVVKGSDGRYRLTEVGTALKPVLFALGEWVATWLLEDPTPAECDPELLMLFISRHVHRDALPAERVTAAFELGAGRSVRRFWLIMEPADVSICLHDPGLPAVVTVRAQVADLFRVYLGRARLADELEAGRVVVEGLPRLQQEFARWMAWSAFAPASAAAMTRRTVAP